MELKEAEADAVRKIGAAPDEAQACARVELLIRRDVDVGAHREAAQLIPAVDAVVVIVGGAQRE
jgi:hypothetical protein